MISQATRAASTKKYKVFAFWATLCALMWFVDTKAAHSESAYDPDCTPKEPSEFSDIWAKEVVVKLQGRTFRVPGCYMGIWRLREEQDKVLELASVSSAFFYPGLAPPVDSPGIVPGQDRLVDNPDDFFFNFNHIEYMSSGETQLGEYAGVKFWLGDRATRVSFAGNLLKIEFLDVPEHEEYYYSTLDSRVRFFLYCTSEYAAKREPLLYPTCAGDVVVMPQRLKFFVIFPKEGLAHAEDAVVAMAELFESWMVE